ncbi:MAG: Mov34/MPN/PAD-1 family protein [Caulobacterales bacterium]
MIQLSFSSALTIHDHIHLSPTREAGGLLFGAEGVVNFAATMVNQAGDPEREFIVDPYSLAAMVEDYLERGQQLLGTFHSHPNGRAFMSKQDVVLARQTGLLLVVATGEVWDWVVFDPGAGGQVRFTIAPPRGLPEPRSM